MTRHLAAALRGGALAFCLALLLPGCGPGAEAPPGSGHTHEDAALQRASKPADAVLLLRDRLLARDGAGFARLAVPPALYPQLEAAWADGRSHWPLEELPLDARIPRMLAALQAPQADKTLMATFKRQFAGADADIDQAIRTLVVFGNEYVQKDPDYSDSERSHIAQAIMAIGPWALSAPLSDPKRAQHFFTALRAAATRSGIDGQQGYRALAALGMTQSLNRLSPFFATLIAQLHRQYGLDLDASLRSLKVSLQQQTGDYALLRLQYSLANTPIDALVPAVRIDGAWYLTAYVARAERALAHMPGSGDLAPQAPARP